MAFTPEQFFGKIGVKNGVFTKKQLDECFHIQRDRFRETGEKEPLSYILQEKKLINREQMRDLLQEFKYSCMRKDDKELAQIAVDKKFLSEEEIDLALNFQRKLFRNGVGLFQLGEILISREILKDSQVFELSCELWLRRHPGKNLPGKSAEKEVAPDETVMISASKKEVEAIQKSVESKGFKLCKECGYQNPMIVEICYGCGEPLIDYEVITSTEEKNDFVAQEIDTNEGVICSHCGHSNPEDAIICFHCFEDLVAEIFDKDLEKIEDTKKIVHTNNDETKKLESVIAENNVETTKKSQQDVDKNVLDKVNAMMDEITQELGPKKPVSQKESSIKINEKQKLKQQTQQSLKQKSPMDLLSDVSYKAPDSGVSQGDDKKFITGKIVFNPKTKVLIKDSKFDEKTMKKCRFCGYVNPIVSPFCFGCHEKFPT